MAYLNILRIIIFVVILGTKKVCYQSVLEIQYSMVIPQ